VPQVIIPQAYDQPYWAQRVTELGIGTNCPPGTATPHPGTPHPGTPHPGTPHPGTPHPGTPHPGTPHPGITPDAGSLADALDRVLQPAVAARAQALRPGLHTTGTHTAATNLTTNTTSPAANPLSPAANPLSPAANPLSPAANPLSLAASPTSPTASYATTPTPARSRTAGAGRRAYGS
jgi:hypothetical protein